MLRSMIAMALSAVVLLAVGCSGGPKSERITPKTVPPAEAAKAALKEIAESGQVGSGADMIRENFEKLKATDAAKAEALLKDCEALMKLQDPQAAKAKAKEMMDKL